MLSSSGYAARTKVSEGKSLLELRATVDRYGGTAFSYGEGGLRVWCEFTIDELRVRFVMPLPEVRMPPAGALFQGEQQKRAREAETRRRWRALNLIVKALLEGVKSGVMTASAAFFAHTVVPGSEFEGMTAFEVWGPAVRDSYRLALPAPGGAS